MSEKLSATDLVRISIIWAEESMRQMIYGCSDDDPYRAEVKDQLRQLLAYRNRRFGKPKDPLAGAKLVNVTEMRRDTQERG